jgi:nitroreductase
VNKIDACGKTYFRARACDLLGGWHLRIMTRPIEPNSAVVTAIKNRRTIHEFRPDSIAEQTLWQILDAARWAPNHRLTEPWRLTIIGMQSREAMADALARRISPDGNAEAFENARVEARRKLTSSPILLAVTCRIEGSAAQQVEDLAAVCAAIQNIQLAAWSQGIGSHWNTGRVTRLPETEALLGLSDRGEELVGFLYLGYPARIPEAPERRPIEDFVRQLP